MAVSKGGSSNNQNQNTYGSYTGQGSTTGNTTGTSGGTTTGTTNGTATGTTTNTNTTIAPEGWQNAWNSFQPGQGGFNPTQQGAVNWFQNSLNNGDPANLRLSSDYFSDALRSRTAPTLRNLASIDPAAYGAPGAISAPQVQARSGADLMGAYENPYTGQVVNAALNDYDTGSARAANDFRVRNIAGGASGAGVNPVGAAIFAGESARGRGALSSGLRADAFNTAAGYGMQDANRALQADVSNQGATMGADQFNANMLNNRQMFDANLGMQYNDQRDRTARDLAGIGTQGFSVGQGLASGLYDMGGGGQRQNIDWLNAALPLFGSTSTGQNNQTTSQNVSQVIDNFFNQNTSGTSTESGSTTGNSSGSSRGKSGGIGLT